MEEWHPPTHTPLSLLPFPFFFLMFFLLFLCFFFSVSPFLFLYSLPPPLSLSLSPSRFISLPVLLCMLPFVALQRNRKKKKGRERERERGQKFEGFCGRQGKCAKKRGKRLCVCVWESERKINKGEGDFSLIITFPPFFYSSPFLPPPFDFPLVYAPLPSTPTPP